MSYQVLARKWRPSRFQEMVGQEHVLKALVNALDDDRLHHAYLFTGTRGVGKTSIARLFAKSLNCETGVSSEPCGQCTACREIAEGRFVDLIEVDAASRTKVEDTRELLENVQYAPTHGRFKVYLIDEVHMLSGHSFNALLKTLEEPPPHVKFLLATTDPQKLPVTILSRCLQFNLKNLVPERIVNHLRHVLEAESIQFEDPALWLLARSADGSMRDALSLTDQAIAYGAGVVNESDVRAMLGTIDQHLVYAILDAVARQDGAAVMNVCAQLAEFSPDYGSVLAELISLLHRVALAQAVPDAVDNSLGDLERVRELAAGMRAEDTQLYYQIAVMGRKDLPYVPHAREGLEMVLLRMLAFRPAGAAVAKKAPPAEVTSTAAGNAHLADNVPAPMPKPEAVPEPEPEPPRQEPKPEPAINTEPPVEPQPVEPAPVYTPGPAQPAMVPDSQEMPRYDEPPPWDEYETSAPVSRQAEPAPEPVEPPVKKPEPPPAPPSAPAVESEKRTLAQETDDLPVELSALNEAHWVSLALALGLSGMTDSLARALSLESVSASGLCFHYTAEQEAMLNQTQRDRIAAALKERFGDAIDVTFEQAPQTRETPAQYLARRKAERQAEAVASMKADPLVQQIIDQFGARIEEESVTPIDPN
ncbi:DNA polymerase III subunit gamma/tau [Marinobacterium litorale]|uniref:DNA polymerase III subunit gamma/tau n=1 Tax=Marinobacterium litorale TaxID=404770 RepID=UPI00040815EB|nr:DNA polymerase III subunit gamma/tau [Marinobacterium litorale]